MRILSFAAALALATTACGDKPSLNLPPKSLEFNVKKARNGSAPVSLDEMMKASGMPPLDESPGLMGPDTNGNGVRDDIEVWIESLPYSADQKKALVQFASAEQQSLTHAGDPAKAKVAAKPINLAITCVMSRFEYEKASSLISKISSYTANTLERATEYAKFQDLMSGSSIGEPEGICEHRVQSALATPASSNAKAVF
jgi:predicted small lipoprotein YifL